MKSIIFLIALFIACQAPAQCPFDAVLDNAGVNCIGSPLNVAASNTLSRIIWKKDGLPVQTTTATYERAPGGVTVAGTLDPGPGLNQLDFPSGIYVDGSGNTYIADYYIHRIVRWAPGAKSGVVVAGGNGQGSAANQFDGPSDLWIDDSGNIYVTDDGNDRVQKWAPGATSGVTVAGGNGRGSAANQLDGPSGIFVDGSGNIYVCDLDNNRVQLWTPGATSGITVAGGNGVGGAPDQLFYPSAIFVDAGGNIYVADTDNCRVQLWMPGATSGITVAGGHGLGAADDQIFPCGIWVDGSGNIYIADNANNRVQLWTPGATAGITVAGDGLPGDTEKRLEYPSDLFMDRSGNLYIADDLNYRVQKWAIVSHINTSYLPPSTGSYTAEVTDNRGCTVATGAVVLKISAGVAPSVNILSSPATSVCAGKPIGFDASVTNGGAAPSYQWQVNGRPEGENSPGFTSSSLAAGDLVRCIVDNGSGCPPAISNELRALVDPSPSIRAGQVFSLAPGGSLQLEPELSGNIASYAWSPGAGLSATNIRNPVASPSGSITYTLKATAANGCEAIGDIVVKLFTRVKIPGAFTPNGDGKNDVFYLLGGSEGIRIKDLSIFSRNGQKIFQVRDVLPNDARHGWDGTFNGNAAPAGTYAYSITVLLSGGQAESFQGTVVLIR